MQNSGEMLYGVNELVVVVALVGLLLLTIELGYRLGDTVPPSTPASAKSPVLAISGAIFGLLALLLGFTFSLSLSRFDQRQRLVVQEANAIGTTYRRTGLLPEPDRSAVAALLRSYTSARLDFYTFRDDQAQFKNVNDRTVKMQEELWSHAADVVQKGDQSPTTGLFIQSLNEVIELHTERVAAMENRVPESVLLLLILVALVAALLVGYGCGLAKRRHLFSTSVMALLIGMVIITIIDLDRPTRGLMRVSQNSMTRLLDSMKD